MSGEWSAVAGTIISWIGQALKGHPKFPNIAAQGIMLAAGVLLYALEHPPTDPWGLWLKSAITWGMLIIASASILGELGLAPRTVRP